MPSFAWVVMAIVLLLVLANIDPAIGGWLLIVVVVSMVFAAHGRTDASGNPLI